VLIPQAGDVFLLNGQLENLRTGAGHCACELQAAKETPQPEIGQLATAEEPHKKTLDAKTNAPPVVSDTAPAKVGPIYQVFMPPLIYDAKAKVQPEPDPMMLVLVRRVRVRPTLIFQARVEGEIAAPVMPKPHAKPAQEGSSSAPKPAAPADSFADRVRNFVRKLWPSGS
jgi:hypothetical protein